MTILRVLSLSIGLAALPAAAPRGQSAPSGTPAQPARAAAAAAARLPVTRVVLYKSGVGYFEHVGRISGSQTVTIDLTSGQLDDVLKSLTSLDLGGGQVTGITYNSQAPIDQRLRTLRIPLGAEADRSQLLNALRGTRVEVQGGGATTAGRILGLTGRVRTRGDVEETVEELTVIGDDGAVRAVELGPAVSVRIAEAEMRRDLGRYLDLLESSRARDVRRLEIATAGNGERELFVSYISEVPLWKTTYRLVLPAKEGAPLLQGWAIVDNTLGEDWTGVELSLVAGAPQSFIQRLSQPYYTQRPVVPPPSGVTVMPQAHEATLATGDEGVPGGVVGGMVGGLPAAPPLPPPPAPAEPRSAESLADRAHMPSSRLGGAGMGAGGALEAARGRAAAAAAQGADLGELFEYRLAQPVTIRRNQSALVPIVHANVSVERVSLWNAASGRPQPLRAVWLTNGTALTLDGGSIALVEANAFAGEGLLEPVKPGEKRLVSYAVDLSSRVTAARDGGPRRVGRVRIANGQMTQVSEERATTTYTLRNEDAQPRVIVVEHPALDGWSIVGGAKPVETTAGTHRFRVTVDPRATATLAVDERRPLETRVAISTLTDDQVALILRGRTLDPAVAPQLQAIAAASRELGRLQHDEAERGIEIARIGEDQARVRENMKALKGSDAERQLVERYTRQLGAQEDRLEALRREIATLQLQAQATRQELARLIEALSLDVEIE